MKVLLDTNIIVDVALERSPYFGDSETVVSLVEEGQIEGYISASTFSHLYYIIRKEKGRDLTLEIKNAPYKSAQADFVRVAATLVVGYFFTHWDR